MSDKVPLFKDMTLRDWFAGQALASIASLERGMKVEEEVVFAYKYVDAMLAARKRNA